MFPPMRLPQRGITHEWGTRWDERDTLGVGVIAEDGAGVVAGELERVFTNEFRLLV